MQTPEEFAALLDRCAHTAEGMGERLTDTYRVADLIRARDAEVRADERGRCSVIHATLADEALVAELVRRGVLTKDEPECDDEVDKGHCHRDTHWCLDIHKGKRRYVTAWEADDD